jgi:L-threonylcarbamoyladenylate synthase
MSILMPSLHADALNAAYILRQEGVIVFPTDTVLGVAASLHSYKAVFRLYEIKTRPQSQATAVLISSIDQIQYLSHQQLTDEMNQMLLKFWPGELTVILKRRTDSPYEETLSYISGGKDKIGIRLPNHALTLQIIEQLGHPLVASSANLKGEPAPQKSILLDPCVREQVDHVVEGAAGSGTASTVIDLTTTPFTLLRPGSVTIQDLQDLNRRQIVFQEE